MELLLMAVVIGNKHKSYQYLSEFVIQYQCNICNAQWTIIIHPNECKQRNEIHQFRTQAIYSLTHFKLEVF